MELESITLLNSSILTAYGEYEYRSLTLDEARRMVAEANHVRSAIGHPSTAALLCDLLEYPVEENRIEYIQQRGETAIIFKLKSRPPEGKVLDRAELDEIGYEFGILTRTK